MLLLAICFGTALWHWWRIPGTRTTIPCKAAMLAWGGICIASLAYTSDLAYTTGELKNELGYTLMAFFSFLVLAADRSAAIWLLRAVGGGLAFIGLWAALAWAGNGFVWAADARYGGYGIFSAYLVTIVPALTWLIFADPASHVRKIGVGLLLLALFLAVIAMQRAAWPALGVQALIIVFYAFRSRFVGISRIWLIVSAITIVVVASVGTHHVHQARGGGSGAQLTDDVRVGFWPKVVKKIAEHPLAGTGFGQRMMYKTYPEMTPVAIPDLWHAHNVLLNYGIQLGVPGIIAFLLLLAAFASMFMQAIVKGETWTGIAGLALIAGVLTRNQFNDFFMRDMSLLFWVLMGIFARLAVTAKQGNPHEQTSLA